MGSIFKQESNGFKKGQLGLFVFCILIIISPIFLASEKISQINGENGNRAISSHVATPSDPSSAQLRKSKLETQSKGKGNIPNSFVATQSQSHNMEGSRNISGKSMQNDGKLISNIEERRNQLEAKLRKKGSESDKWEINFHKNGIVQSISGGVLPEIGKSTEQLEQFILDISPELGVPSDQVNHPTRRQENSLSIIYDTPQFYETYEIEGGFIRTQATPDGKVYYVASELKNIGHPKMGSTLNLALVESIIRKKYPDSEFTLEKPDSIPIRIYATEDGASELSWICMVDFRRPKRDRRKIIIGEHTQAILLDESQLKF